MMETLNGMWLLQHMRGSCTLTFIHITVAQFPLNPTKDTPADVRYYQYIEALHVIASRLTLILL